MAGRSPDGPPAPANQPVFGDRTAFARPLADDSHQRHRLWVHRQRVSGHPPVGRAPADAQSAVQPQDSGTEAQPVLGHFLGLAARGRRHGGGAAPGRGPGPGMGRNSGLDRPGGPAWPAPGVHQLHSADRQGQGTALRLQLVLPRGLRLDVPDLCDGELHAPVLGVRNRRRRGGRTVHPRPGRPLRDARWAGG